MQLAHRRRGMVAISLVAMIDVLMILLVFFMVTSTYLDLDMVPLAGGGDAPSAAAAAPGVAAAPLLLRLAADGSVVVRGRVIPGGALEALVAGRLEQDPTLEVVVLPSGGAPVQALAALMDAAVKAGAPRLRIVRLEGME